MKWLIFLISVLFNLSLSQNISNLSENSTWTCGTPMINDDIIRKVIENIRVNNPSLYELMIKKMREDRISKVSDAIGTRRSFFVYNFSGGFDVVVAELRAIGTKSQVWVDTADLNRGTVTAEEVNTIITGLENRTPSGSRNPSLGIIQLVNNYLGLPPNKDGDGKTDFLITDIKEPWVAGFFISWDQTDNPGSNKRDILYIDSRINFTESNLGIFAHEYQHLVHYNYDRDEATFVNEGLSEVSEVICGYDLRDPGSYFSNINMPLFTWSTPGDYARAALFTLYYTEQLGDDVLRRVVQEAANGKDGLDNVFRSKGSSFVEILTNWFIANFINDKTFNPKYGYTYQITKKPKEKVKHTTFDIISEVDTICSYAVSYILYNYSNLHRIEFLSSSSNLKVKAVILAPPSYPTFDVRVGRVFKVPNWTESTPLQVVFVVMNIGEDTDDYSYKSWKMLLSDREWTYYTFNTTNLPGSVIYQVLIDNSNRVLIGTNEGFAKLDDTEFMVYYTKNSDLPSDEIYSLALEFTGNLWLGTNIWIGTNRGLVRYGKNPYGRYVFSVFDIYNSDLKCDTIFALFVDSLRRIWIGTPKGLQVYDRRTFTNYIFRYPVYSITEDITGNILCGTNAGIIKVFSDFSWSVYNRTSHGLPSDTVLAILVDSVGNKWVGSAKGLAKFDLNWGNRRTYLTGKSITALAIDRYLWVGTNAGLARFDGYNWRYYMTRSDSIKSIAIDALGNKWIGSNTGLYKFNIGSGGEENWSVYPFGNGGLTNDIIRKIAIDSYNNRWIITHDKKLIKYDGKRWKVYDLLSSIGVNFGPYDIRSISIDRRMIIWISILDLGLIKFDGVSWRVYNRLNSGLPSDSIWATAIDGQNNVWLGTRKGLVKFDGVNWTIYNSSNSGLPFDRIYAIAVDDSGNKWLGTVNNNYKPVLIKFDGVNWYRYDNNDMYAFGLIEKIAIDDSNNIWTIGEADYIFKFDGKKWIRYSILDSSVSYFDITIDKVGKIWVGTDKGLFSFYPNEWFRYNIYNSNLWSNYILTIAVDSFNNKWIGTGKGLFVHREGGVIVDVDQREKDIMPSEFVLYQNYPNPFNPETIIEFDIPNSGKVKLVVYDILGRVVKVLVDDEMPAGRYRVKFDGRGLASGVYFYSLVTDKFRAVRKMMLLK